jgi:SPT2 chromatin protein
VKAAATGRTSAKPPASLAPPRLKLTTAAAEAAGKIAEQKKGTQASTNAAISKPKSMKTAAATAAAASALIQSTPPETLKKSTTTTVPPAVVFNTKKMLRHQQMTSLGVQTVQLLCIPPTNKKTTTTSENQGNSTFVEEEQQNQVPGGINFEKTFKKSQLPLTNIQNGATTTTTKSLASPRRQHAAATVALPNKIKQRLKGTFYGSAQPPAARHRIRTVDDESDSDLDSFIETDDDESDGDSDGEELEINNADGGQALFGGDDSKDNSVKNNKLQVHGHNINDNSNLYLSNRLHAKRNKPKKWKMALKEALNGYDATKFADVDAKPDRRMHASYEEIIAEEARAGKIGRKIDRIEAEKEIAARLAEKEERQKRRRQQLVLKDDSDSDNSGNNDVLSDSSDDEDEEEGGGVEKQIRKRRKKLAGFLASF